MKKTPLEVAQHIGEEDAAALIEALLEGRDDSSIGLGKDLDLDDAPEEAEAPMTPRDTEPPVVTDTATDAAAKPIDVC